MKESLEREGVGNMRSLSIVLGLLLCIPVSVWAQPQRPAEVAGGGYSFVRDFLVEENFPLGWFASGSYRIFDWLDAVGEVSGTYKKHDFTVDSDTFSTTTRLHSYLGGVRHSRPMGRLIPFGQFLVGVTRETGGVTVFRQSIAEPQTKLTLQPGGGVDIPLTDRLSARFGADYRRIFAERLNTDEESDNQLRFAAGVVVGMGR